MDTTKITRAFGKAKLGVQRNLDLIELVSGMALIAVGTVTIAKEAASDEFKEAIENHKAEMAAAKEAGDKKTMAKTCAVTAGKLTKQFGLGVGEEVLGGTLVVACRKTLKDRNAVLASEVATATTLLTNYRKRVIEDQGKEKDEEYYYGMKKETVVELGDNDNPETKEIVTFDENGLSPYVKIFDETNVNWEKDPESNKTFILNIQRWANQRLKANGYLFLNDVLKDLGFPITKAGQYVGWIYDADDDIGDNYISFRMFDGNMKKNDFINGYEPSIILDFNVDGDIMNRLHLETV